MQHIAQDGMSRAVSTYKSSLYNKAVFTGARGSDRQLATCTMVQQLSPWSRNAVVPRVTKNCRD